MVMFLRSAAEGAFAAIRDTWRATRREESGGPIVVQPEARRPVLRRLRPQAVRRTDRIWRARRHISIPGCPGLDCDAGNGGPGGPHDRLYLHFCLRFVRKAAERKWRLFPQAHHLRLAQRQPEE